eukprot:6188524-Pleurochrysis_carterae.AAC.3
MLLMIGEDSPRLCGKMEPSLLTCACSQEERNAEGELAAGEARRYATRHAETRLFNSGNLAYSSA